MGWDMNNQAEAMRNLQNQAVEQRQQMGGNAEQETILTMFDNSLLDLALKTQLQAARSQPTAELQLEAIREFFNSLRHAANINNKPEAAHKFVLKLAKDDPQLCDKLSDKQLAQTKNIDYQKAITKQNITELFENVVRTKLFDRAIQQQIREEIFEANGQLRPKFSGAKDEVMKSVFSLCETVYASKKMHAAYSELKWPAFMLWGAIFRLIVSKLAEEDPAYLQLLEADAKPNSNNMQSFMPVPR
jgi:hypothetical protein